MKNIILFILSFLCCSYGLFSQTDTGITFYESFDDNWTLSNNPRWTGSAAITNIDNEIKQADIKHFDNNTPFVKLNAAERGTTELILANVSIDKPSVISFRYRTEIISRFGQTFTVYIDDKNIASFDGANSSWLVATFPLPGGMHTIKFEVVNLKGTTVVKGYNAVYLDNVIIVPDVATRIELFPRGDQITYLNASGSSQLKFYTKAYRADGSLKDEAKNTVLTTSGGTIDSDGFFTPPDTGSFTVTAALGKIKTTSGTIKVVPEDFIKQQYMYKGTGKTYSGFTKKKDNSLPIPKNESVTISYPSFSTFEADGFFLLEGTVTKPKSGNYARILVTKITERTQNKNPPKAESWYFVKNNFSKRIWLPFGTGEYKIEIFPMDTIILTKPPKGDGMVRGGSYTEEPLTLTVFNTREEDYPDGDGRWIYPSYYVESDDFRITNLYNSIVYGITDETEKIKAVHDYIVSTLVYDLASYNNTGRSRRMDAVSVIENGTAVCEGYANLTAALLRTAGIPVKIIANKSIGHAWNNVYSNGKWFFYDATWDDPLPDRGEGVIGYTYFMLDSLTGGDNRHRGAGTAMLGDAD